MLNADTVRQSMLAAEAFIAGRKPSKQGMDLIRKNVIISTGTGDE